MGRVIFKRANLLDGEHPARPNVTVVIEGERIARVARDGDRIAVRADDRVFDLKGKTLMPGMYLCHFHAGYENVGTFGGPLDLQYSPPVLAMIAARNAKLCLHSGFTGAVGAGTAHNIDAALKEAIAAGFVEGPRLLAAGRDLVTSGSQIGASPHWWRVGLEGAARFCDGPDEFRKAVREEIAKGADVIKLYPTIGHPGPWPPDQLTMTLDEIKAAADATHERGKKIRAHVVSKKGILACCEAGLDIIDHADALDGECIEAILKTDAVLVPSAYYSVTILEGAKQRGELDRPRFRFIREELDRFCSMLPEAQAAGVKMVLGDDYGTATMPHGTYAKEMEVYVKRAGIEPLEVLRWATKNGAECMGHGKDLGTIEEGKLADLLVVDGDPSKEITVLQDQARIHAVMKGGTFVKNALAAGSKR